MKKLEALTSIKKDVLNTAALKNIAGGYARPGDRRMLVTGGHVYNGNSYSADRAWEEAFGDISGSVKWAHIATTHLND